MICGYLGSNRGGVPPVVVARSMPAGEGVLPSPVVVLGPTRDRHGLLGCGARRPCAAIHGCVGQELNAAVLLGLVAYLKILHDLCLRVAAKTCQCNQAACDGSVDSGGHQIQNVGKGQMVGCNFGGSAQGFDGLGLLIYKWVA